MTFVTTNGRTGIWRYVLKLCCCTFAVIKFLGMASALSGEFISPPPPFVEFAVPTATDGKTDPVVAEVSFKNGEFRASDHVLRFPASRAPFLSWKEECQLEFFFRVVSGSQYIPEFSTFETDTKSDAGTMICRSSFPIDAADKNSARGTYVQTAKLVDSHSIEMEFSYQCPSESADKFKHFVPVLRLPRSLWSGKHIKDNHGKELILPTNKDWDKNESKDTWGNMCGTLGPDVTRLDFLTTDTHGFSVYFPENATIRIFRSQDKLWLYLGSFEKQKGSIKMSMRFNQREDISESKKDANDCVVAGINFTQCDNLNVPVYSGSANLFMNPSFNSGFRYFRNSQMKPFFMDTDHFIVDCISPFGNRAMLMDTMRSIKTFGIPILADTSYVFSFYAKPKENGSTKITVSANSYASARSGPKYFSLKPNEWTRCEFPFSLVRRQVSFAVGSDKAVLLGGLQLEKGTLASEYCGNPYGMQIQTASSDRMVCDAAKPIGAKLVLRGPVGAKGTVRVQATDFFYREFYKNSFPFDLSENGQQQLTLPVDSLTPLGPSVISATLQPEKGNAYTDYFRLTRIKYVGNKFKHTKVHTTNGWGCNLTLPMVPDSEFDLFRKCGYGGHYNYSALTTLNESDYRHFQQYNIPIHSVGAPDILAAEISRQMGRTDGRINKDAHFPGFPSMPLGRGRDFENITPEFISYLEDAYCQMAKRYSFINHWMGYSEPGSAKLIQTHKYDDFARTQIAMCKGIKRGNPEAKVIFAGSCGMNKLGRDETMSIIEACGRLAPEVKFDGMEIHTYRSFPEQPDTDSDLKALLDSLKKLGYDDDFPVYLNEGAYFYPLNVPVWMGIAPWASTTGSKDPYYTMNYPSYDMGWAARLQAAMTLRHWLVCYKYGDRIKAGTSWAPKLLDCNTPHAVMPMSSALADILGNADFKLDIRFAPGARAYVFEDEQNRPVAAVWYFSENVERGKEIPPRMSARFSSTPEFLDMFGNKCSVSIKNGECHLPLSNFPFFIRGKAGEIDAMCENIQNASVDDNSRLLLNLTAKPLTKDKALIDVANPLSRSFHGTISINNNTEMRLDLDSCATLSVPYEQKDLIADDKIANVSLSASVTQDSEKTAENIFKFRAFAANYIKPESIKIDASSDDWKDIPAISMTDYFSGSVYDLDQQKKAEFHASYRVAWNENAVYLLITVNDTKFEVDHSKPEPSWWYAKSAVQLFWDTRGNAREKEASNAIGYDEDDYSYELLPSENGQSAVAYRRVAPDTQLTGGVNDCLLPNMLEPGVHVAFRNDNGKQVYEVEFPARYIQPLQLVRGTASGFGIYIFDHTGNIVTTNGSEGKKFFCNPHNCPYMLLIKGTNSQ